MKVVYQTFLLLFIFSCATSTRISRSITPTTKIQIAYFWITTEDGKEYFLNAVNFIETGDMWVLYTAAASDEPEFLDVFQIDRGNVWYAPFMGRTGTKEISVKDYVADLFVKSLESEVKEIRVLGFYEL